MDDDRQVVVGTTAGRQTEIRLRSEWMVLHGEALGHPH